MKMERSTYNMHINDKGEDKCWFYIKLLLFLYLLLPRKKQKKTPGRSVQEFFYESKFIFRITTLGAICIACSIVFKKIKRVCTNILIYKIKNKIFLSLWSVSLPGEMPFL